MAWTSLTFDFGSLLTSTKMTQLYDNFAALANGDTGAPSIQTAAIADNAITLGKISNAFAAGELFIGQGAGVNVNNYPVSGDATLSQTGVLTLDSNIKLKGWITFNGTGTIAILDSYNVASIVDDGTGLYTVNWDTDFATANYAAVPSCHYGVGSASQVVRIEGQAAGSIQVQCLDYNWSAADSDRVNIIATGDQ